MLQLCRMRPTVCGGEKVERGLAKPLFTARIRTPTTHKEKGPVAGRTLHAVESILDALL